MVSNARRIAVLIPVHNRLEYTKRALGWLSESLQCAGNAGSAVVIVLIDDGSTDGTADWVAENHPAVRLLRGDGNRWWSGAVTMGARYALDQLGCGWVLLWNNDVRAAPDYFENLFRLIEGLPENMFLGSKIFLLHRPDALFCMGCLFNPRSGKLAPIGVGEQDGEPYNQVRAADWTAGMGTAIPRKVFETIGFWDAEAFPQYHGDSDFCLRAKKAGFQLRIHPELRIWNDKTSSGLWHGNRFGAFIRTFFDRRSNYHLRTQFLFYRRHAESPLAWMAFLKTYAVYIGGFFKWKLLGFFGVRRETGRGRTS